jgi:hypothetical protein
MDLDLTPRAAQVLHDLGARTVDDVCTLTRPQIEDAGCKARDVASVVQALLARGRRLAGRVDLVDPWRTDLRDLRAEYGRGIKVYRASTGGLWGKCVELRSL